jgi:hypothetical protein
MRVVPVYKAQFLFDSLGHEELDTDFIAGHTDELAASIGQACGGQQQKEFSEVQSLDGLHDEARTSLRDIDHEAVAAPRAIDGHDEDFDAVLEADPFVFSLSLGQLKFLPSRSPQCLPVLLDHPVIQHDWEAP